MLLKSTARQQLLFDLNSQQLPFGKLGEQAQTPLVREFVLCQQVEREEAQQRRAYRVVQQDAEAEIQRPGSAPDHVTTAELSLKLPGVEPGSDGSAPSQKADPRAAERSV